MQVEVRNASQTRLWTSTISDGVSICAPVRPRNDANKQCGAFGLDAASKTTVCSVDGGAPVNCENVTLNAHANGTHTECAGHITRTEFTLASAHFVHPPPLLPATLLSVSACLLGESGETYSGECALDTDMVVTKVSLLQALVNLNDETIPPTQSGDLLYMDRTFLSTLVLRACPIPPPPYRQFTGTNPPYLTLEAAQLLVELGVEHFVVDLPSIDRESSGGTVPIHATFFGVSNPGDVESESKDFASPSSRITKTTVTEICDIPTSLPDGKYLLALAVPSVDSDAAPSRPVLYTVKEIEWFK